MALDGLSLATVPLTPFFNSKPLPEATGFIWKRRGRYFLITNWHVVSALHCETGAHLLQGGARPDKLRVQFIIRVGSYEREAIDIPIRNANDEPQWLIHVAHKTRRVDIVAIPLNAAELKTVTLLPVNELAPEKLSIVIGREVFILGYPFGSSPPAFPVWKRGSIASEPDLVRMTTGYYLVDTASRPGMSGSPVILRSWTNHMEEPGVLALSDRPYDRFIGVYSGRLYSGLAEAQIGMVWHADYIDDIIDGDIHDT